MLHFYCMYFNYNKIMQDRRKKKQQAINEEDDMIFFFIIGLVNLSNSGG